MNSFLHAKAVTALKEYTPLVIAALQPFKGKTVVDEGGDVLVDVLKKMPRHPDKNIDVFVSSIGDGNLFLTVNSFLDAKNVNSKYATAERRSRIGFYSRKGVLTSIAKK